MPYIDNDHVLSDEQAVTASAKSTNTIDLGAAGAADGRSMRLIVEVDEDAAAVGAATVNFGLRTDSDSAMGSPTVLAQTDAIGKASLTVGTRAWEITLPPQVERYVDVYYTVATGPLTAGKFTAFLAMEA